MMRFQTSTLVVFPSAGKGRRREVRTGTYVVECTVQLLKRPFFKTTVHCVLYINVFKKYDYSTGNTEIPSRYLPGYRTACMCVRPMVVECRWE